MLLNEATLLNCIANSKQRTANSEQQIVVSGHSLFAVCCLLFAVTAFCLLPSA